MEKTEMALEHYDGLLSLYGAKVGIRHARKHLAAYAEAAVEAGFHVAQSVRTGLVTSDDPNTVISMLRSLYLHQNREAA